MNNRELHGTELNEAELEQVSGGMTQKEVIDHINEKWKIIPEPVRNKIIEIYVTSGPAAARKFTKQLIEQSHLDYLTPLLDLFR